MPDPRDAHLPIREIGEKGVEMGAEAFCEEGGDENLGEKIALGPALFRAKPNLAPFPEDASWFDTGERTKSAGNFFPFFHRPEILAHHEAGAMNDSLARHSHRAD